MPRKPREKSGTGIYHIMMRGINKQTIFQDDEDRSVFLERLETCKQKSQYKLYGYCLMSNHVHLLMRETKEPISSAIKRICGSYVYWYNDKYARCGHLFQERFKSEPVEDDAYFLVVLRYIHQNPLKAGLAKTVSESPWTSYHEYVRGSSRIVDIDFGLDLFSQDRTQALKQFVAFMNEQNDDQCLDLSERVKVSDEEVRDYLRKLGVVNAGMLQHMDREARNYILARLLELEGVSIRQLSRITGIPKSVIARVSSWEHLDGRKSTE